MNKKITRTIKTYSYRFVQVDPDTLATIGTTDVVFPKRMSQSALSAYAREEGYAFVAPGVTEVEQTYEMPLDVFIQHAKPVTNN